MRCSRMRSAGCGWVALETCTSHGRQTGGMPRCASGLRSALKARPCAAFLVVPISSSGEGASAKQKQEQVRCANDTRPQQLLHTTAQAGLFCGVHSERPSQIRDENAANLRRAHLDARYGRCVKHVKVPGIGMTGRQTRPSAGRLAKQRRCPPRTILQDVSKRGKELGRQKSAQDAWSDNSGRMWKVIQSTPLPC